MVPHRFFLFSCGAMVVDRLIRHVYIIFNAIIAVIELNWDLKFKIAIYAAKTEKTRFFKVTISERSIGRPEKNFQAKRTPASVF